MTLLGHAAEQAGQGRFNADTSLTRTPVEVGSENPAAQQEAARLRRRIGEQDRLISGLTMENEGLREQLSVRVQQQQLSIDPSMPLAGGGPAAAADGGNWAVVRKAARAAAQVMGALPCLRAWCCVVMHASRGFPQKPASTDPVMHAVAARPQQQPGAAAQAGD